MAFKVADDVRETTTTSGTANYELLGAATGFQAFIDGIGNANSTSYSVRNGADFEVGIGTLTGGNSLSRDIILESSNAGVAVNWAGGVKDIYCTLPAKLAIMLAAALDPDGADANKILKVNAGGTGFDLVPQGTGGGLNADKLDGKHYTDINPMTAVGDIIVGGTAGAATRLAVGAAGTYLRSNGTTRINSVIDGTDIGTGTIPAGRLPQANTAAIGVVELATAAEASAGTDPSRAVTPEGFGYASFAYQQTWYDVTASRSHSTVYQNTSGRPMMVNISTSTTVRNFEVNNGSGWTIVCDNTGGGTKSFVVQPGNYYRINGSLAITRWSELL